MSIIVWSSINIFTCKNKYFSFQIKLQLIKKCQKMIQQCTTRDNNFEDSGVSFNQSIKICLIPCAKCIQYSIILKLNIYVKLPCFGWIIPWVVCRVQNKRHCSYCIIYRAMQPKSIVNDPNYALFPYPQAFDPFWAFLLYLSHLGVKMLLLQN